MTVGSGEVLRNVFRAGETWQWALLGNGVALLLVFRPAYDRLEGLFKFFLAVLSISFVGSALWVGPDFMAILRGLYRVEMPGQHGRFNPLLVAVAMIGAVGGSLMNLAYPYFLEAKGWRGPQYRKVQLYDFLVAIAAMILLNLAVWTLGAELLYPDKHIKDWTTCPVVERVLGEGSVAVFAAISRGLSAAVWSAWEAGSRRQAGGIGVRDSSLPGHRVVVPRLSSGLDGPGNAGLHHADSRGQQRPGGSPASAGGRGVVDHRQRTLHRGRAPKPLVGERGHGCPVRARALRRRQLRSIDPPVPDVAARA